MKTQTRTLAALNLLFLLPTTLASAQVVSGTSIGPQQEAIPTLICADSINDQGGSGCLQASSVPTSGLLFPYPGDNNVFTAPAVIAGGKDNTTSGLFAAIGGGQNNTAAGNRSTVSGGNDNTAAGARSTVGGGWLSTALGYASTVGGGQANYAQGTRCTVGGGRANTASEAYSTVGGGWLNTALGIASTVGGGETNNAQGTHSTVGGGHANTAAGNRSTVSGGQANTAGQQGTVGGGFSNAASGYRSTVAGGTVNTASGAHSMVPGGRFNVASGGTSFAAGRLAEAMHNGAFVWGDNTGSLPTKPSSADDQFNVYAAGGTRIFSDDMATSGVTLAAGGGSWTSISDRNAKENFEPVDGREVLERLASIPISTWNYKSQDKGVRHMGPMAQDFFAAFGLGLGDTTIDTIDPDGIALAAIQGLNEANQELADRLSQRDAEISALREEMQAMKALLGTLVE